MPRSQSLCFLLLITSLSLGCATAGYLTSDEFEPLYEDKVDEGYKLIKTWEDYSVEEKNSMLIYKQYIVNTRMLYHRVELRKSDLVKQGDETEWFGNGYLRFEGKNNAGKRMREWRFYSHEDGSLLEKGDYFIGDKQGMWVHFNSSGDTTAVFNYTKGKKDGNFKLLTSDGDLYKTGNYEKGELKNVNKLVDLEYHPQEVLDEEITLVSCDDEGKKARQLCRKNKITEVFRMLAEYPDEEFEKKITGVALIQIEIDENGIMSDLQVLRAMSDGFRISLKSLKNVDFVFKPAIKDGKPYKTTKVFELAYFPPEYNFHYNDFMFQQQFIMPPPPNFTPPTF